MFQTSEARVPKVVSDRVPLDQTFRGMVDARDVDAVNTVALVLALTAVVPAVIALAIDEDAVVTSD